MIFDEQNNIIDEFEVDGTLRLDMYLHKNGFTSSREKAKQLILDNCVMVNDLIINKPSAKISRNTKISINRSAPEYVGRGANKLEKAVKTFNISVKDAVAVDIGASTGGFTDYLLQNGAKKVYAVDVGHGQLHEKLRNDGNVVNIENTNFRYIKTDIFKDSIDIIVADVSFISLNHILPKIVEISNLNTNIVTLVKPQFEAGKSNIGKNGIVNDKKIHASVLNNFKKYCLSNNMHIENMTFSPIKGGSGNIEYLAYIKKGSKSINEFENEQFKSLIKDAFDLL